MDRFLLDTNMLLGFTRRAAWAQWAYETYDLGNESTMVFTSVICRGELLALAEKNGWGSKKRESLVEVLNRFPTVDLNKDPILNHYAELDTWTHGRSVVDSLRPVPPKPAVSMKQNDLWIAATVEPQMFDGSGDPFHLIGCRATPFMGIFQSRPNRLDPDP